jgi:hypothetical protein
MEKQNASRDVILDIVIGKLLQKFKVADAELLCKLFFFPLFFCLPFLNPFFRLAKGQQQHHQSLDVSILKALTEIANNVRNSHPSLSSLPLFSFTLAL